MTQHCESPGQPSRGSGRAGKGRGRRQPYAWLGAGAVGVGVVLTAGAGVAHADGGRGDSSSSQADSPSAGSGSAGRDGGPSVAARGGSAGSAARAARVSGPVPSVATPGHTAPSVGSTDPGAVISAPVGPATASASASVQPAPSAATDSPTTITAPVETTTARRGDALLEANIARGGDATGSPASASRRATRSALSAAGSAGSAVMVSRPGSVNGAAAAPAAGVAPAGVAPATVGVLVGLPPSAAATGTAVTGTAVTGTAVTGTAATFAAAAAVQPATPPVMQALNTAITNLFDSTAMWLSDLPASPARDLISGALLLVRRTLFNQLPTAVPRKYLETSTGQYVGTVGAVDPEGDVLIYSLAQAPQYGTVQIAADGIYTYTPGANFAGIDKFTVAVTDPGFNLLQPFASRQSLVPIGVPNACGRNPGAAASAKSTAGASSTGGGCGGNVTDLSFEGLDLESMLWSVAIARVSQLDAQIEAQREQLVRVNELIGQTDDPDERANLSSTFQMDMIRLQSLMEKRDQAFDALVDQIKITDQINR